jgi:hypothetical protein
MRGAVKFEAEGKTYSLRLTTNVLCGIEEETCRSIDALLAEMNLPGKRTVTFRYLFCRALGDRDMTLETTGDLIDSLGAEEADALLARALQAAFPPRDASAEGNGAPTAV